MTPFPAEWAGRHRVVLADPPWSFATWSDKGKGRSPDGPLGHYGVMSMAHLKALPVADVADRDAALFMWVLDSMLPQALELGQAWGFGYKTVAFTWAKRAPLGLKWAWGLGYWTRRQAEQCLLFTRGKPARLDRGVGQLIEAPVRQHSRKPDETHRRIQRLVSGPYLELFARQSSPGWTTWGNEVTKFDGASNGSTDAPPGHRSRDADRHLPVAAGW